MPFVKLDCGILDSSLWVDRAQREVFITALLMAVPRELTEAFPSLHPETGTVTGWEVPAGWYGLVEAAGPGIVRRSLLEMTEGMAALVSLTEPDPMSRSDKNGGRRLARIDGGYIVLNFMEYRDKDHTGADRARRYRERLKENQTSHRDTVTSHRDITHADADADAEEIKNPPTPLKGGALELRSPKNRRGRANGASHEVWDRLVKSEGADPPRTEALQQAIDACGGWMAIRQRTAFDEPKLRKTFEDALKGH